MIINRAIICIGAAAMLGGCVSLLPQVRSAPSIYTLSSPMQGVEKNAGSKVVLVTRPTSTRAISRDDIVLAPGDGRIAYAGRSRWAEPVPEIFQRAIMDAIAGNPEITAITPTDTARAAYTLHVDLRNFEAVFDNGEDEAPYANVNITATLTQTDGRKLIGKKQFSTTERASERALGTIVTAQRNAALSATQELSNWMNSLLVNPQLSH